MASSSMDELRKTRVEMEFIKGEVNSMERMLKMKQRQLELQKEILRELEYLDFTSFHPIRRRSRSLSLSMAIGIICLLVLQSSYSGGVVHGQAAAQGAWCVARPSASDQELRINIDFVCRIEKLTCDLVQPGGACFEPNTLINHASVAMNLYYQLHGRNDWDCYFDDSAIVAVTDPAMAAAYTSSSRWRFFLSPG